MAVTVTCYIDGEKITTSGLYKWSRVANFSDRISIIDGKAAFNGKIMYYNGIAVSASDYPISDAQYTTTPPASDTGQPAYIGIGGVARQVKSIYIGVDGVARKVKKAYIGVDGVARLCYTADASGGVIL